jgi:peptide/nickel transport system permease protein
LVFVPSLPEGPVLADHARHAEQRKFVRRAAKTLVGDRALLTAVAMLILLVAVAVVGPLVWRNDPLGVSILDSLQAPSRHHPMGTDSVGRDVFARFMRGAQISLLAGLIVVVVGSLVGGIVGLVSGTFAGIVDGVLMRVMDAVLAFPPLILAMAVTVALGAGLTSAALGITIASVPWYARVLRSEVIRVRSLPFIEAAGALGATRKRIIVRHVVPQVLPTLFVQGAAAFGFSVLSLAALGFVGLGAQIPTPEWGAMITDGLQYTLTGQWWIGVFPGFGLLIAVTAANIIADRAREILDPRGEYSRV